MSCENKLEIDIFKPVREPIKFTASEKLYFQKLINSCQGTIPEEMKSIIVGGPIYKK